MSQIGVKRTSNLRFYSGDWMLILRFFQIHLTYSPPSFFALAGLEEGEKVEDANS